MTRSPTTLAMPRRTEGPLLGVLMGLFVIDVAIPREPVGFAALGLFTGGALVLALRGAKVSAALRHWSWVLGSLAIAAGVLGWVADATAVYGGASLALAGLTLLAAVSVAARTLEDRRVVLNTILGAISVYLLLAFTLASLYGAIQGIGGEPFFAEGAGDRGDFQYFSLVTMTTLGYGDFTAAAQLGRSISALQAFIGQIYVAVVLARLVALFRQPLPFRNGDGGAD